MYCLVCKSKRVEFYKIVDGVNIFRCKACRIAFVDSTTPRKNTSHIYIYKDYKKRENQYQKRYIKTLSLLKKYLSGKRILEVGAGFGLLSNVLYKNGYKIDALEPSVKTHYLKKLPIRIIKKSFSAYSKTTRNKYDAVMFYDVFEHFDRPKEIVKSLKKLVNKKGLIFIQTPNYLSLMAMIVKKWSWWMLEDHRFFYSKDSFDALFDKRSWKRVVYKTQEEWIDFKKNLDGNFVRKKILKYIFFCLWIPSYFFLRKIVWFFERGGLIITIYQKR